MLAVQWTARARQSEPSLCSPPPMRRARRSRSSRSSGREIGDWFVARTGYTGEDGFEIMLPGADTPRVWGER